MPTQTTIDNLNLRFAIPGVAQIANGKGGLLKIQIATSAVAAEIYLHGAQVTSWKPAGAEEILFLSELSRFEDGKAIRGGIPICFPWFRGKADDTTAPAHGFVRTKEWELESIEQQGDLVVVTLATGNDETGRRWWPQEFQIVHRITVGPQLKLELTVSNTGPTRFSFEEAQHAYYRVGAVESLRIADLENIAFLDNRDENRKKMQFGDVILSQATDNAYLHTEGSVDIFDASLMRRVRLQKEGSETTIVWNPWADGASSLADLSEGDWRHFACVEAGNILNSAITLQPGETHTLRSVISVMEEPA